ncbi:hypothetical protein BpHYR1_044838 [Brachionus plicatilis]|uniref:Uncharacterized protein n=1 Tax=Brachionus plicatilis TaxID=10195 RepID=A0A3M7RAL7_BRAPC|nr:hypothetical protein BpHYR1_044838 [Brachionus plicatilis]
MNKKKRIEKIKQPHKGVDILTSLDRDDQLWIQILIFFQTLRDRCYWYGRPEPSQYRTLFSCLWSRQQFFLTWPRRLCAHSHEPASQARPFSLRLRDFFAITWSRTVGGLRPLGGADGNWAAAASLVTLFFLAAALEGLLRDFFSLGFTSILGFTLSFLGLETLSASLNEPLAPTPFNCFKTPDLTPFFKATFKYWLANFWSTG